MALVIPDSPAEKAGVKRGNILLKVNATVVNTTRDLRQALQGLQLDATITLTVLHGDDERTLLVTFDDTFDNTFDATHRKSTLGMITCDDGTHTLDFSGGLGDGFGFEFDSPNLPDFDRERFFLEMPMGALVLEVVPDSPAEAAGLMAGDVIEAVDGTPVGPNNELALLIQSYKPGDTVMLDVRRGKGVVIVEDLEMDDVQAEGAPEDAQNEEDVQEADKNEVDGNEVDEDEADENESLGEPFTIEVEIEQRAATLGAHPDDAEQAYLGVRFAPAPSRNGFGGRFTVPAMPFRREHMPRFVRPDKTIQRGAVVMQVAEGSPAATAGLAAKDVITAIGGVALDSPRALIEIVAQHNPGAELTLSVQSADGERYDLVVILSEDQEGYAYLGIQLGTLYCVQYQTRSFRSASRVHNPAGHGPTSSDQN